MYKAISPGAIGVKVPFEQAVELAAAHGFKGIYVDIIDVVRRGPAGVRSILADHHLRPAGFGLPVEFRKDDDAFADGLGQLPQRAAAAAQIGCRRCSTWVPSWHDELPFERVHALWMDRFTQVAQILNDHGIRLGLEFLGPATLRKGRKTEFIHTMADMLRLCGEIGTGNVGLLLDSFHWYTSGGTLADLGKLTNHDVVDVHVNDAPAGISPNEQMDNRRAIPGATGVIDLTGFLRALYSIGYEGPVMAEPFSKELADMPPAQAVRTVSDAIDQAFAAAGIVSTTD